MRKPLGSMLALTFLVAACGAEAGDPADGTAASTSTSTSTTTATTESTMPVSTTTTTASDDSPTSDFNCPPALVVETEAVVAVASDCATELVMDELVIQARDDLSGGLVFARDDQAILRVHADRGEAMPLVEAGSGEPGDRGRSVVERRL